MIIKLYRHTIKHTEYCGDSLIMTNYRQTDWSCIEKYVPGDNKIVVKIEEKYIWVNE